MRWMFVFLVTLLIASDFLGHNPGLGPGLSVKNACLYVVSLALMFRIALGGQFKLRMPGLHMAWALWIGYAILTFFTAWLVIHYRNYSALQSAIALKSDLIDSAMFCFAIFYGVHTEKDYRTVMIALMAAMGISSILTLTDLAGLSSLAPKLVSRAPRRTGSSVLSVMQMRPLRCSAACCLACWPWSHRAADSGACSGSAVLPQPSWCLYSRYPEVRTSELLWATRSQCSCSDS